ncbi:hypothetical protein [Aliarcobacter cryaerophilus]|uniref:hypothetical protein n=1 Tax=Aliarcobacter cryaerophilus TaxID=28198 RepID=UPI0021B30F4B|nr:hypothetical protein [Aliarcobacter cryaerophilus]MCT7512575.1 hypothetical protein [Aliarcobacter cryaerophilus]
MELKVKDKWNNDFGILSYDLLKDKFHFKYDDKCKGYGFSDINIKNGREFEKDKIFNVFSFYDSYAKNVLIKELNLSSKSENEIQFRIKEYLANTNKMSCRGFYFEEI